MEKTRAFIVCGMRVTIGGGGEIVDIRGRRGDALFFMATITPEHTVANLKACLSAVQEVIRQAGAG